jgi:hypothetical protein
VTDINDERLMTRFLLGDLLPAERQAIEERLATDPEYFEALAGLEDDLILKWHRGELSDGEERLFTESYFSSPSRQARVASAGDLIEAAEQWKVERWKAAAATGSSVWTRLWRWLSIPRYVPPFAAGGAVALLVVAVSVALFITNDATRRLQLIEQENSGLRRQVETTRRLAVAFTLAPVGERGTREGLNLVLIPRDADEVRLQFEVADLHTTAGLDAIIEPLADTVVATAQPVRVARTPTSAHVALTMAAGELPDGDCVLRLRRAATGGGHIIIATRAFRVSRD